MNMQESIKLYQEWVQVSQLAGSMMTLLTIYIALEMIFERG